MVRIKKGSSCITEAHGSRTRKLGEEGLKPGELRFVEGVRYYGLHHGRPRELVINVALCWKVAKSRAAKKPEEPWYLATTFEDAKSATNWYWQRGWIEQSFREMRRAASGLSRVRVGSPLSASAGC